MKTCSECGQKVALNPTAPGTARIFREHFSVATGTYTYRCRDCQQIRVQALIARTCHALGLPSAQAHS